MESESLLPYPTKIDNFQVPKSIPAAGLEYYSKRISERLEHSQIANENYRKYQTFLQYDDPFRLIDFTPVNGVICPSSRCNFKCTMCAITDFENGKRCEDMSLELFERRLNDLPGLVQLSLTGLSELFLLHETLEPMLRMSIDRKIWTNIATNGSLLHQRNWMERLVDINLDEIVISIDGVSKETFEAIRIKSNFERVRDNAKKLNSTFESHGVTPSRTKMQTVLQKRNLNELFDFIPLASSLGFKSIAFETEPFDWGLSSWRAKNGDATRIISQEDISKLLIQGDSYGVQVGFVELTQRYVAGSKLSELCSWPFYKTFIASDDRVVPCCHIANPDAFEIGQGLNKKYSAQDAWFGEAYRDFRTAHATGKIPDACSSCYRSKQ